MKTATMDAFRRSKAEGKEHTTPPPQGHTLAEILQDEKRSDVFGKLLIREKQADLAARVAQRELRADDIKLLEQYRLKFSEMITRSEQIGIWLAEKDKDEKGNPIPGTENIIKFAQSNEDFEQVLNLLSPEKATKAIQGQLEEIAITDEERFNGLAIAMETHKSYLGGEYKKTNDKVEKMCKDGQFTPQEYFAALAIEDPGGKEKALKQLARRSMSGFKKLVDALSPISSIGRWANRGVEKLEEAETSLETSFAKLEEMQGEIGQLLFYSVAANTDMRNALTRELVGDKTKVEEKSGFGTAKEAGTFDEEAYKTAWETYKDAEAYDATINDYERDQIKDRFINDQKTKYKEKMKSRSVWGSIFTALFEGNINRKRDILK